jgi:hypothetical protein
MLESSYECDDNEYLCTSLKVDKKWEEEDEAARANLCPKRDQS